MSDFSSQNDGADADANLGGGDSAAQEAFKKYVADEGVPDEDADADADYCDDTDGAQPQNPNTADTHTDAQTRPSLRRIGEWETVKLEPISFCVGTGMYSSVEQHDTTHEKFFQWVGEEQYRHANKDKSELPTFTPCTLNDYTIPPPSKDEKTGKLKRPKNLKAARVNYIWWGGVDVDNDGKGAPQTIEQTTAKLVELGVAHAVYSTPSHKPDNPRFRIVFAIDPLPVSPGSREDAAAYAETYKVVVGTMLDIRFDKSCTDLNQYYIYPSLKIAMCPGQRLRESRSDYNQRVAGHEATELPKAREAANFIQYFRPGGKLNMLEIFEWVRANRKTKAGTGKKSSARQRATAHASEVNPRRYKTANIHRFVLACAEMFDIERAYRELAPDDVHGGGDDGWLHCRCGNDRGEVTGRQHTKGYDDGNATVFGVRSPKNNPEGKGFTCHCFSAGCAEHFAVKE